MRKQPAAESANFHVTLRGDELARLREYQQENGFPSLQMAARALVMATLDEWPRLGISRSYLITLQNEIRMRFLSEIIGQLNRTREELEAELAAIPQTEGEPNGF